MAKLITISTNSIAIKQKVIPASAFKEDDYTSEILNKVKLFVSQFADLFQGEIIKIFANKFQSRNLYKLQSMRKCNNIYQDQISNKKKTFKMEKITDSYKNYNSDNIL